MRLEIHPYLHGVMENEVAKEIGENAQEDSDGKPRWKNGKSLNRQDLKVHALFREYCLHKRRSCNKG